ncbi:transglycosylase SLT domain-containing protein [Thiolapillus sp.]|uniref:transglycosylase SLT domain-containing protein n=3 Tax=Thiolapillus sp. TaxID=2017437 RepID=UPI0027E26634|nr:transglycosylase SLT domain-containing protein [Thiolapillus sp.]
MGVAYENGEGVSRSPREARSWYCRAAIQGLEDAWYNLGWMYVNGCGVAPDDDVARYWLKKSAAAGNAQAAQVLKMIGGKSGARNGCNYVATLPWLKQRCTDPDCRNIVRMVENLSQEYDLDANLVLSVIRFESGFNVRAHSPKGASGLMQLIPETAVRFGVRDIWDVEQNIRGGMAYLRWLLAYFKGDLVKALAGYNAGERRVLQYGGVPPYRETRGYVKRIIRDYGKSFHRYDLRWLDEDSRPVQGLVSGRDAALPAGKG